MINDLTIKEMVGGRLKKAREVRGMSIREAAEHIGKTYQWLSAIENGTNYCNVDDLYKLSRMYTVQLGQLLDMFPPVIGSVNIEQRLKEFTLEITNHLPTAIPVYSQYEYLNPEGSNTPFDWVYWSPQRVAGRNLVIIQIQTHNLEPDLLPNDRCVIELGLNAANGLGLFFIEDIRLDFNSTFGARLLEYERDEDHISVWQKGGYKKEYSLDSYKGQVIQVIRNMYATNSSLGAYRDLAISKKRKYEPTDP